MQVLKNLKLFDFYTRFFDFAVISTDKRHKLDGIRDISHDLIIRYE